MTAQRMVRSVVAGLGAAALWAFPTPGAQARGYHPNPPRQGPAQASSQSNSPTPEGCFRRYDERCQRARESRRRPAS